MASGDASTVSTTYRSVACQGVNFWVPERYRNIVGVGSGSYGSVCKAIDGRDAEEVAIKRIGWTHKSVVGKDYWIKEIVMPPNKDYDAVCLVSKFMKTDLNTLLAKCPTYFTTANIFSTMYAMLNGLFAMHSAGVMHRDLKPSNILIDGDGTVRLADFGLGRDAPDENAELTNYVVTRWYRAPEILLGERYTMVVDIWSLGCVFAELLSVGSGATGNQRILFPSRNYGVAGQGTKEHISMILAVCGHTCGENDSWVTQAKPKEFLRKQPNTQPLDLRKKYPSASDAGLDLLKKLLAWNPNDRPSAQEAFRHPYWESYAWTADDEDQPWPTFDGSFSQAVTSEQEARRLVNLEITRFHPEFASVEGVEVSNKVCLRTTAEGHSFEDDAMYGESDMSASNCFDQK